MSLLVSGSRFPFTFVARAGTVVFQPHLFESTDGESGGGELPVYTADEGPFQSVHIDLVPALRSATHYML